MAAIASALIAALVAGCQTDQIVAAYAVQPVNAIAFESVDGPPPQVFDRLVAKLAGEAEARQLPVVSRTVSASWRVRMYLAVDVRDKKAAMTWVADVFDAGRERAFRISGEEPLPGRGDLWAQTDDTVLGRVAARTFDALSAGISGNPPVLPAPEPTGAPVVALAGR